MYNREIKEQFLEEFTANGRRETSCKATIDDVGVFEEVVQKDYAQMTMEEAFCALSYVRMSRHGSVVTVLSLLKNYVIWCEKNRVFSEINSELVNIKANDVDISKTLRRLLFKSEDEFIRELRSTRSFDDGYFDVVVMVFAWLGIGLDEIHSIKISDVNFEERTISVDNGHRVVSFSEKLGDILLQFSKTKSSTRMTRFGLRDVYRDDSYDMFVRKFCAKQQLGKGLTKSQIKSAIHDLNQVYIEQGNEPRFTTGNVIQSGALFRVFQLESSGVDVFSIKNKELVRSAYRVIDDLSEITWTYRNYKRAFNL